MLHQWEQIADNLARYAVPGGWLYHDSADHEHTMCFVPDPDAAQLRQALGLLSTLAPDVEMDADHPVEMAKAIEEVVIAQRKAQYGLGWIKAMQCVNKIDGFCVQSNLDPVHVDKIAKQVIECVLNHMRSEMP